MNDRVLVNLRLDRDVLEELDRASADAGLDRSELVRRLLVDGLRRSRVDHALEAYRDGLASAEAAAESAGVSLYEMLERISEAGVPYRLDDEVFEALDRLGEPGPRDVTSGIDDLRSKYRPATVSLLLVGESSPAGGTPGTRWPPAWPAGFPSSRCPFRGGSRGWPRFVRPFFPT